MAAVAGDDFPTEHRQGPAAPRRQPRWPASAPGRTFRWHGRYSDDLEQAHDAGHPAQRLCGLRPELPPAYRQARMLFLGNIDPHLPASRAGSGGNAALVGMDTMNFWISGSRPALLRGDRASTSCCSTTKRRACCPASTTSCGLPKESVAWGQGRHHQARRRGRTFCSTASTPFAAPAMPLSDVVDPTGLATASPAALWASSVASLRAVRSTAWRCGGR